ncbi:HAD-like domain-containing protein [Kickxella alabastrina]|uniref:HAD-like domain-containing protein n=1 Tax=Kickxella alabastrina TaxID=61397 RepID=UPI002220249D|nr:HAD-like domain-containing protein [Kickxella alabastrina]KAI7826281.1 HAD-like domain-containing protein [Kickxella alabastrina]
MASQARRLANIRLVTFDIYNTLYMPAEPVARTYARPLWRHGLNIDEHNVAAAFSCAYKQTRSQLPNYGCKMSMTSRQWWELVIRRTWIDVGVNLSNHPELKPEIPGIKIGVISNMDESAEHVLKHFGIREYFDFVIKSISVGVEKPAAEIFEMALIAVNIPAYDSLHIGDSYELDYLPATKVGMKALLVRRDTKESFDLESTNSINSIGDIIKMI